MRVSRPGSFALAARSLAALLAVGSCLLATPSNAININIHMTSEGEEPCDPNDPACGNPDGIPNSNFSDPNASKLEAVANAAAQIWEDLLPGSSNTYDIYLEYDDDIFPNDPVGRTLPYWFFWPPLVVVPWSSDWCPPMVPWFVPILGWPPFFPFGSLGPSLIAGTYCWEIEIKSDDDIQFFADPTPHENEEFGAFRQRRVKDLLVSVVEDGFAGSAFPVPSAIEVGFEADALGGGAADANYDLLSLLVHEIGHAIGLNNELDQTFELNPSQVFGSCCVELDSADELVSTHLDLGGTAMYFVMANNKRVLPSAGDVLAIANVETPGWSVDLARVEYQGTGNWSDTLKWLGGNVPNFKDLVFVRAEASLIGGIEVLNESKVTLNQDAHIAQLIVDEGGSLHTGSNLLEVGTGASPEPVPLSFGTPWLSPTSCGAGETDEEEVPVTCLRGGIETDPPSWGVGGGITVDAGGTLETEGLSILDSKLTMAGGTLQLNELGTIGCEIEGLTCPSPGVLEGTGTVKFGLFLNTASGLINNGQIRTDTLLGGTLTLQNLDWGFLDLDGHHRISNFLAVPVESAFNSSGTLTIFSSGHPFVTGDVVAFSGVVGMTELNFGSYTVGNFVPEGFELAGEDGNLFSPYVSGGLVALAAINVGELGAVFVTSVDLVVDSILTDAFDGTLVIDSGAAINPTATFLKDHAFGPGADVTVNAHSFLGDGHLNLGGLASTVAPVVTKFLGGSYSGEGTINQNGDAKIGCLPIEGCAKHDILIDLPTGTYNWDGVEAPLGAMFPSTVEVYEDLTFAINASRIDDSAGGYEGTTLLYGATLDVQTSEDDDILGEVNRWTLAPTGRLELIHSASQFETTTGFVSDVMGVPIEVKGMLRAKGHPEDLASGQPTAHLVHPNLTLHPGGSIVSDNGNGANPPRGILQLVGNNEFKGGTLSGPGIVNQVGDLHVTGATTVSTGVFDFTEFNAYRTIDGGRLMLKATAEVPVDFHSAPATRDSYTAHLVVENGGALIVRRGTDLETVSPSYSEWNLESGGWIYLRNGGHISGSGDIANLSFYGGSRMRVRNGGILWSQGAGANNIVYIPVAFEQTASIIVEAGSTLALKGETQYEGVGVGGQGTISQDAHATVTRDTTVYMGTFDLDGALESTSLELRADLTVNAGQLETSGSNTYDGWIDVVGPSALTMNLPASWELSPIAGITVHPNLGDYDSLGYCSFVIDGQELRMNGSFTVGTNSCAQINAPVCGSGIFHNTPPNGPGELILNGVDILPGCSIGTLTVNGSATLGPASTLTLELLGNLPSQQDRLVVSGTLDVNGGLAIVTGGSFVPTPGLTVSVIQAGTIQGAFFPITATSLGGGLTWDFSSLAATGSIQVVVADEDGDDVGDNVDNCLGVANPSQANADEDAAGDACDDFPSDATETTDSDGDGVGDNSDVFPNDPQETEDSDGDRVGDNGDAFPRDPNETVDTDQDGIGNNADLDDDEDGLADAVENDTGIFLSAEETGTDPLNPDTDGDGLKDGEEVIAGSNPLDPNDPAAVPSLGAMGILFASLGLVALGTYSLSRRSRRTNLSA